MIEVSDAARDTLSAFDAVIDVRSPAEFAEDHAPGAINLPVLNDEERAQVGTIYVQKSKFLARRVGAALVSRNIADHLLGPLSDKPGGWRPLIYCWRGGQRSTAMATVLSQVGWRVGLLSGGYRTYRRRVTAALYDSAPVRNLVLLSGGTGSGKTALLALLAARGVQTLDLEALAAHRGSLFGGLGGGVQPSQKMFESRLLAALDGLDPTRPTVVEAESSRIGEVFLPPTLWNGMTAAPRIELHVPAVARARHVIQSCREIADNPQALGDAIMRLPRHHSREARTLWQDMARGGQLEALALALIEAHYDPAYRRSAGEAGGAVLADITLPDLDEVSIARGADAVAGLVADPAKAILTP